MTYHPVVIETNPALSGRQGACGHDVPWADSALVSGRLEGLARAATLSGYASTMTSSPELVSRAIFEWWWITKDNRGRYARRIRAPGAPGGAPPELSMDDVGADAARAHAEPNPVRSPLPSSPAPRLRPQRAKFRSALTRRRAAPLPPVPTVPEPRGGGRRPA